MRDWLSVLVVIESMALLAWAAERYGAAWTAYAARTSRLIPWF